MPALTVLQKLKAVAEALPNDSENLQYVDIASEFFMNSLPDFIAQNYYVPVQVTDGNGLECGTKYGHVIRDGIPCRQGMAAYKFLYESTSAYQVNKTDPLFYKEAGKIYIKPNPTAQEIGYVASIPRNFISDYTVGDNLTEIPNTPANAEHIILLYSAFLILQRKIKDLRLAFPTFPSSFDDTLNTLAISFPTLPTINVDTTLSFTALDALSMGANSIADYQVDAGEIDKAFEALENAYQFVGSLEGSEIFNPADTDAQDVPKGAFWLDDEDPEMVNSAVNLAAQEVRRASAYFDTQGKGLQSFATAVNAAATEYQAKVSKEIQKISAQVQKISADLQEKSLELQKHNLSVSEVQVQLQKFNTDVQQRLEKNNQIVQRYAQQVGGYQQKYSQYIGEVQMLFQQYAQEYAKFLGYESQRNN